MMKKSNTPALQLISENEIVFTQYTNAPQFIFNMNNSGYHQRFLNDKPQIQADVEFGR